MNSLTEIEDEMSHILEVDKKNWGHFYLLLKQVEEQNLWKTNYNSFTQWVKDYCVRTHTHESIIWNKKKAGKVYESYQKEKEKQGIFVPPIEKTNVSCDSLVLLDKINKYDSSVATTLVDKVMGKGITKSDLREVYTKIREEKEDNKTIKETKKEVKNKDIKITANDIVVALCNEEWLNDNKKIKKSYFKSTFETEKYKAFTEFPCYTGTSKKSRRIDVLAIENITSENTWNLNLHAIEIKVAKHDLINDNKYTEYIEFADYGWLAVPLELIEVAKEYKYKDCGIISVEKKEKDFEVKIVEAAKRIEAYRRGETLEKIIIKLLKG